jgi:hypothetical protein
MLHFVQLTCLMMSQNETGLELRSADNGGILPERGQLPTSIHTLYLPNHPWNVVGREDPCIKGVETSRYTDGMRIILAKIDGNLRVVIHHDASNILSIRIAVHLQKERCGVVPVSSVRRCLA